jgi:hypothetical protein
MDAVNQQMAQKNPDWKIEYDFSMLPLHEKLQEIGVGSGTTKKDAGYREFFDIIESGRTALEQNNLTTFDGKKAIPIAEKMTEDILELREKNKAWWASFRLHLDVRDFGLGAHNFPGDSVLYGDIYEREEVLD